MLVGARGTVYAFEPLPRNLIYLKNHVAMNHAGNCRIVEAAVSSSAGDGYFHCAASPLMGHLSEQGPRSVCVKTVALDGLIGSGEALPPNVIKCDIEGGEYEALLGAREILGRHRPVLFLSTHGEAIHRNCMRLLAETGYSVEALDTPDELVARSLRA